MNAAQRTELQSFMDLVQFEPGQVMLKQGKEPCVGFLVAQGTVEELVDQEVIDTHKKGDLAASIQAISEGSPSPHTLRASGKVKAYMLGHQPFKRFLAGYPGLYLRLLHRRRGD